MRMWQKAVGALFLLAVNNVQACWDSSWLVGASGIYAVRRGDLNTSLRYAFDPRFPIVESDNLYSNKGFGTGLLAGYQLLSNGWLWGLEGSIDWHDMSQTRDTVFTDVASVFSWDASSTYKRGPIAALSGRMAYEMTPYLFPYIRLGIEGSEDKLELTLRNGNPALVYPVALTVSDQRWNWHYLAGIGFETPLWCTPMTVRFEYNYHSRAKSLFVNGAQALANAGVVLVNNAFTFSSEMHARTQSGKISFVWNFS